MKFISIHILTLALQIMKAETGISAPGIDIGGGVTIIKATI
jgi:hypothetical protein